MRFICYGERELAPNPKISQEVEETFQKVLKGKTSMTSLEIGINTVIKSLILAN